MLVSINKIFLFLFIVSAILLFLLRFYSFSKCLEVFDPIVTLCPENVRATSEYKNIKVKIASREPLLKYLSNIGFWEKSITLYSENSKTQKVKSVNIVLTDKEQPFFKITGLGSRVYRSFGQKLTEDQLTIYLYYDPKLLSGWSEKELKDNISSDTIRALYAVSDSNLQKIPVDKFLEDVSNFYEQFLSKFDRVFKVEKI